MKVYTQSAQLIKYIVTGGLTTGVNYLTYFILLGAAGDAAQQSRVYLAANSAAWLGAVGGSWALLRARRAPRAGRTAALVALLFPVLPLGALAFFEIRDPHWFFAVVLANGLLAALVCFARAAALGLLGPGE